MRPRLVKLRKVKPLNATQVIKARRVYLLLQKRGERIPYNVVEDVVRAHPSANLRMLASSAKVRVAASAVQRWGLKSGPKIP